MVSFGGYFVVVVAAQPNPLMLFLWGPTKGALDFKRLLDSSRWGNLSSVCHAFLELIPQILSKCLE